MLNTLFSKTTLSMGTTIGTAVGALFDMSHGIHPLNAIALICGAFASVCIGIYHLRKK